MCRDVMDLFTNLKSFFKINGATIDNSIFRLHYKFTSVVLLSFSILVTSRQYFGDPIRCVSISSGISDSMLDAFCWVHGTFSIPSAWEKEVGNEVPYPGVDKYTMKDKRVYHAYYQWVSFVLFLQALLFYTPWFFWKAAEKGRIKNMTLNLDSPVLNAEDKALNKKLLVEYLETSINHHGSYVFSYVTAEVLNLVNVIGQIFLIDVFLGNEFSKYGTRVLEFTNWEGSVRFDPMIKVFPRVTKCNFHYYGTGGSVSKADTMCVLPINIINEKIYIFIWFWFIILAVLSAMGLAYRCITIASLQARFMATRSRARLVDPHKLDLVIQRCRLGDWFLLHLIAKNLDPLNFRDIINKLAESIVDGKKYDVL